MITGENHRFENCDFERESDGVESRRVTRGNIARAYYHAIEEYGLQVDATRLDMLKQWNRQDPTNCRELKRNNTIQRLQGTRNYLLTSHTRRRVCKVKVEFCITTKEINDEN